MQGSAGSATSDKLAGTNKSLVERDLRMSLGFEQQHQERLLMTGSQSQPATKEQGLFSRHRTDNPGLCEPVSAELLSTGADMATALIDLHWGTHEYAEVSRRCSPPGVRV